MDQREYNKLIKKFKIRILKHISKKKYEKAIDELSLIVRIIHIINDRLYDDELEKCYDLLVNAYIDGKVKENKNKGILFYDSIFSDTTVLSRQYLQALIDMNIKFVYLVKEHVENEESKDLINMAINNENCTFLSVKPNSNIDNIYEIKRIIEKYNIGTVLIQSLSFDISALVAFASCKSIKTFYVNHMDDQFWIGNQCFDYYLNFSETVRQICIQERNVPREKCVIHKYYPYIKKQNFQGMPLSYDEDNIVIFSGGRFTKVIDEQNTYLRLVKKILIENQKAIFLYAGSGDSTYMKSFLENNPSLKERWIIIDYRSDLYELFQHVDLYLGTYPIKGGLMTLYAAYAGIPILELNDFTGFQSEELFTAPDKIKVTFDNQEDLLKQAKLLICSTEKRKEIGREYQEYLPNREKFSANLQEIFNCVETKEKTRIISPLDAKKLLMNYSKTFESERKVIVKVLINSIIFKVYPILFIKNIIEFIKYTDVKTMKMYFNKALIKYGLR